MTASAAHTGTARARHSAAPSSTVPTMCPTTNTTSESVIGPIAADASYSRAAVAGSSPEPASTRSVGSPDPKNSIVNDGTSRPTASSESTGARRWASRAAPSADGTSAIIAIR